MKKGKKKIEEIKSEKFKIDLREEEKITEEESSYDNEDSSYEEVKSYKKRKNKKDRNNDRKSKHKSQCNRPSRKKEEKKKSADSNIKQKLFELYKTKKVKEKSFTQENNISTEYNNNYEFEKNSDKNEQIEKEMNGAIYQIFKENENDQFVKVEDVKADFKIEEEEKKNDEAREKACKEWSIPMETNFTTEINDNNFNKFVLEDYWPEVYFEKNNDFEIQNIFSNEEWKQIYLNFPKMCQKIFSKQKSAEKCKKVSQANKKKKHGSNSKVTQSRKKEEEKDGHTKKKKFF